MIVYFGFAYPKKAIESLFSLIDGRKDHLVMICDLLRTDRYQSFLIDEIQNKHLLDNVNITGYLPPEEAARVMAAADAVVLPFSEGSGFWNTSLRAAQSQGTFVLTTSITNNGYVAADNVYNSRPGDLVEMRRALNEYAGRRVLPQPDSTVAWENIAEEHIKVYSEALTL